MPIRLSNAATVSKRMDTASLFDVQVGASIYFTESYRRYKITRGTASTGR